MELTKEELVAHLRKTAANCHDWISVNLAEDLAEGLLELFAKKAEEQRRKLNIVHMYFCAVFHPGPQGQQRECDCGSTQTVQEWRAEIDGS